jgi:hypothetical protein
MPHGLFQFYEGTDPSKYTELTGINLNRNTKIINNLINNVPVIAIDEDTIQINPTTPLMNGDVLRISNPTTGVSVIRYNNRDYNVINTSYSPDILYTGNNNIILHGNRFIVLTNNKSSYDLRDYKISNAYTKDEVNSLINGFDPKFTKLSNDLEARIKKLESDVATELGKIDGKIESGLSTSVSMSFVEVISNTNNTIACRASVTKSCSHLYLNGFIVTGNKSLISNTYVRVRVGNYNQDIPITAFRTGGSGHGYNTNEIVPINFMMNHHQVRGSNSTWFKKGEVIEFSIQADSGIVSASLALCSFSTVSL